MDDHKKLVLNLFCNWCSQDGRTWRGTNKDEAAGLLSWSWRRAEICALPMLLSILSIFGSIHTHPHLTDEMRPVCSDRGRAEKHLSSDSEPHVEKVPVLVCPDQLPWATFTWSLGLTGSEVIPWNQRVLLANRTAHFTVHSVSVVNVPTQNSFGVLKTQIKAKCGPGL